MNPGTTSIIAQPLQKIITGAGDFTRRTSAIIKCLAVGTYYHQQEPANAQADVRCIIFHSLTRQQPTEIPPLPPGGSHSVHKAEEAKCERHVKGPCINDNMDSHVIILEVPAHLRADKVNYSPIDETEDAQVLF